MMVFSLDSYFSGTIEGLRLYKAQHTSKISSITALPLCLRASMSCCKVPHKIRNFCLRQPMTRST